MKTKKKTKSLIGPIVSICLLLALVAGIGAYGWGKKTGDRNLHVSRLSIKVNTIREQTKLYSIQAEYPEFGTSFGKLNSAIKEDISTRISEFKTQSAENWQERKKFALPEEKMPEYPETPFSFTLTWSSQQMNDTVVSLVLHIEQFVGGANMMEDIATYNYDMVKKTPITLSDLFPNDPNYLQKVSQYTRQDLTGQLQGNGMTDMIDSGTEPIPENFSRFTYDENTITFYFPKYQVAPGAFGSQTVVMPRSNN